MDGEDTHLAELAEAAQRRETLETGRVLSLGVDTEGGYAVPYQLDGVKRKPRRPRKP